MMLIPSCWAPRASAAFQRSPPYLGGSWGSWRKFADWMLRTGGLGAGGCVIVYV